MSKNKFQEKVLAKLAEDGSADALSLAISKKAESAIKLQIAGLEGELVDDESKVEDATEALSSAILVTSKISDAKRYCQGIVNAQAALDSAKEGLENTKASLAYFRKLQKENF
jgi:hypothetical protein